MEKSRIIAGIGRILISLFFIVAGLTKIFDWQGSEAAMIRTLDELAEMTGEGGFFSILLGSVPITLGVSIGIELLCGVLLFSGAFLRTAALILALYLAIDLIAFHHFWLFEGLKRDRELLVFAKNLALIGSMLVLMKK
ncbi:MAG: DoxX family membrane protein [Simkaniaceae bacterium]|nr:DoxX family membrane protein [Simkaniaceae bacterium]